MEPITDALLVVKAAETAKRIFDHFKDRIKTPDDILKLQELQEAFQTLRDDNARLREELRRRGEMVSARGTYRRKEIGNAVVRVRSEEDGVEGPPCCPRCDDANGEPLPLQGLGNTFRRFGTHMCPGCENTFTLR